MKTSLSFATFWLSLFAASAAENFAGVGIILCCETNKSFPRIEALLPNAPASKAGVRSGVLLTSIDGVSTERKTMAECVRLMRGEPDTRVVLECVDPAQRQTNKFTLTRIRIIDKTK
jgi:carboxyl-terminal processing protease